MFDYKREDRDGKQAEGCQTEREIDREKEREREEAKETVKGTDQIYLSLKLPPTKGDGQAKLLI